MKDKAVGVRSARDENGKSIQVPDDMTYDEWYKKYVDEYEKSGIIEEKKKILKRIQNNELTLDINTGNQNKHIKTSHSYNEEDRKSVLYGDEDTARKLVNKYHGTGSLKFTSKGKWTNKEFIETENDIGEVFDKETQKYVKTNRFAIHYGKNGTHVVPRERRK